MGWCNLVFGGAQNSFGSFSFRGKWVFVSTVYDSTSKSLKTYLNGIWVASDPVGGTPNLLSDEVRIGLKLENESDFNGQLDEVQIWNIARTPEEIAKTMHPSLSGKEPGLVGYWQFEGVDEKEIDVTGNGHDGQLKGDAVRVQNELPAPRELLTRADFYQDYLASLKLELFVQRRKPSPLKDVLSITARRVPKSTVWKTPSVPVRIEIRDEASKLLGSLQSRTDQPVDWAVPDGVQGTLGILAKHTDASGKTREVRFTCQAHSTIPVAPPRVGHWESYEAASGLDGSVTSIRQDRNGMLWFCSPRVGVFRYDGRTFQKFTAQDGLPSNNVLTLFEDRAGVLWFGTYDYWTSKGEGVCRYDGATFQTFTTKDGLASDAVTAIYEDTKGHLWFGTYGNRGVSEFDGVTFRNYTPENGFPSGWLVGAITQDKDGGLWFGRELRGYFGDGTGATRYDGSSFQQLTTQDGLVHNDVTAITTDAQGNLWFGTTGGVSKLSKASSEVSSEARAPSIGTKSRASGYDGKVFQNFTTAEGLGNNSVNDVLQTKNGDLWFATDGGSADTEMENSRISPPRTDCLLVRHRASPRIGKATSGSVGTGRADMIAALKTSQ